ncbi:hypothetical protein ACFXJ5_22360 [Streptomyces sp. NPDC059373]
MKIFLSWSGPPSKRCAELLAPWLRYFSPAIVPFVSSASIRKGARGLPEIAEQLDGSYFGIACITLANLQAPWINFESGALSKQVDERAGRVIPFLLEGTHQDLEQANSPLRQFQVTLAHEEADVLLMVKAINDLCEPVSDEGRIENLFRKVWPELKEGLDAIDLTEEATQQVPPHRTTEEILEELNSLVKEQISRITDLERAVDALRNGQASPPRRRPRFTGIYDESSPHSPHPPPRDDDPDEGEEE